MRIVDSGVLIAAFRVSDELHSRAAQLLRKYVDQPMLCTYGILQEVVEHIRRHDGASAASEAAKDILYSNRIVVEAPSRNQLIGASELMKKFQRLSFFDSLTMTVAREKGIREILSFDSDFDAFKDLRRLS